MNTAANGGYRDSAKRRHGLARALASRAAALYRAPSPSSSQAAQGASPPDAAAVSPVLERSIDLKARYPVSARYILKQLMPWLFFMLAIVAYFLWSASGRNPLGEFIPHGSGRRFAVYLYVAAVILGLKALYITVFRATLFYRLEEDNIIIRKGIFLRSATDFPLRRVQNIVLKRDVLDYLLGICSVEFVSANEDSDLGGNIPGLGVAAGQGLSRYMRRRVNVLQGRVER
jgi:membrane protein YdbS with pleckstrin-like domain